ncbi:MAG: Uma2 family endonuclease [Pyrinomonadaceae bacterium]
MAARIEPLLTVADLDLMPDDGNRYELIEGELIVSRAPSLPHQRILTNLLVLLNVFLKNHPLGEVVPTPGVIFDNYNAVIPDIVFIAKENLEEIASGDKVTGAPDLAIEIISPGAENARRDRVVKLQTYSKFGVQEYWVVDGFRRTIDVYRQEEKTLRLATTLMVEAELTTPLLPDFSCQVRQIFEG